MREQIKDVPMKYRVLDFSNCRTWNDIHSLIREELELPVWYGKNLDALWDSITGIMYCPADVTILFHPKTKPPEGVAEYIDKIIRVFYDAEQEFDEIILHTSVA